MAYDKSSSWITDRREEAGITQGELAGRLGVTQQTVSRWESGKSTPSRKLTEKLAAALDVVDIQELLDRAGRTAAEADSPRPVRPLLKRLELGRLAPDDFEAFCRDLILLRHPGAEVSRFGDQGHKQDGIDLIARLENGSQFTYQCKRVNQFGPAKVRAMVEATTIAADRHYLLLSRVASPGARKETAKNPGWVVLDVEDLSSIIRLELVADDSRRLIDTYFPGWRQAFLGLVEPGIWLTPEEFFRPMLRSHATFSHRWILAGRSEEIALTESFLASDKRALVIVGPGGSGKSRLLREVALRCESSIAAVRFLAPEAAFRQDEIEHLPESCVLVIDDAHDREDITALLASLARSTKNLKVILSTRPYGRVRLVADLRSQALVEHSFDPVLELRRLSLDSAEAIAQEAVGSGGNRTLIADIARATRDCPLFTVIAGQLASTGNLDVALLASDETAQNFLLRSFRDAMVGSIGDGASSEDLREVLRATALVQPLEPDSKEFRGLIASLLGMRVDRVVRSLRILEDGGVLIRRSRKLRVMPDLLGDFLIAEACVDPKTGSSTGLADEAFALASGDAGLHIVQNLAKLDWRVGKRLSFGSQLLDDIWEAVTKEVLDAGVFGRQRLLTALSDISYYQPQRALALAMAVLDNPTNEIESSEFFVGRQAPGNELILASLPKFIRGAAMHLDLVGQVSDLLWNLGRNDDRPMNSNSEHAVRILTDLASLKPGKPVVYCEAIIERAIAWTDDPQLASYVRSPIDVLEAVLATEGFDTVSRGWTINMNPFSVRVDAVRPLRKRVVACLLRLVTIPDVRVAVRAAEALGVALRYPRGQFGATISDDERSLWTPEFVQVLEQISAAVDQNTLDPVVEEAIRRAINWHVSYCEDDATRLTAQRIIERFDSGIIAALTRALAHGWAHAAGLERVGVDDYEQLELRWRYIQSQTGRDLRGFAPSAEDAANIINDRLDVIFQQSESSRPSAEPFLSMLCDDWPEVAQAIIDIAVKQPNAPIAGFSNVALASIGKGDPDAIRRVIDQILQMDQKGPLVQLALALTYVARSRPLLTHETEVLKNLGVHQNSEVRRVVVRGLRFASAMVDPERLALLLGVDISGDSQIADEVLGNFGRHGDFEREDLTRSQIDYLLDQLVVCLDIGEYGTGEFLATVSATEPLAVAKMLVRRVDMPDADADYRPIPFQWDDASPLRSKESTEFADAVGFICTWMSEPSEGWQRSFWAPHLFAAMAGTIDGAVVDGLGQWAGSADPLRLETISNLLREMPRELLWDRIDWTEAILNAADSHGPDCYRTVCGDLQAAMVSGVRSGTPGEPFPHDIEQRDRSRAAAGQLRPGSPSHRFFMSLVAGAEASIEWSLQRDEDLFDG